MVNNNNFGEGRLLPVNLQFFAEEEPSDEGAGGSSGQDHSSESQEAPTVEELIAQLAQERALSTKYKNLNDKLSGEAAEAKRQLKERMSAEEQASTAAKEAEQEQEKHIKELEEKLEIIDNTSFWGGKTIGMDDVLAKSTAEAEAKGDKDTFRENIAKHIKAVHDSGYQKALKERPDINAGNGGGSDSLAEELAKKTAQKQTSVDENSLKEYLVGGF